MKLCWPGFNEMGLMLIPLEWSDFIFPGKRVSIEEEWFEPKDELHVTVISKRTGRIVGEKMSQGPMMAARVRQEFEAIDWGFDPAGPVHIISRLKEKSAKELATLCHERTLILRLNMPGMAVVRPIVGNQYRTWFWLFYTSHY